MNLNTANDYQKQQSPQLQQSQSNQLQLKKNAKKQEKSEPQPVFQNINMQNVNVFSVNMNNNQQHNQYNFNLLESQKPKTNKSQLSKGKPPGQSFVPFDQGKVKFNHTQYIKPNQPNQYGKLYYNENKHMNYKMKNEYGKHNPQILPSLQMKAQQQKTQTVYNNFNSISKVPPGTIYSLELQRDQQQPQPEPVDQHHDHQQGPDPESDLQAHEHGRKEYQETALKNMNIIFHYV